MAREPSIAAVRLGGRPAIVAAGGEQDLDALVAADGANVTELRGDLFEQPTRGGIVAAIERLRAAGRPIIFTARAAAEGGRAMPEGLRGELYRAALPLVDAIDVEIASLALAEELISRARPAKRLVILSAHDFTATPSREALLAGVERARALGADLRILLDVTLAARADGIVSLVMGPLGPLSRIVLPAAGSLLTYGAAGRGTAPGQLPVTELASLVARLFPS